MSPQLRAEGDRELLRGSYRRCEPPFRDHGRFPRSDLVGKPLSRADTSLRGSRREVSPLSPPGRRPRPLQRDCLQLVDGRAPVGPEVGSQDGCMRGLIVGFIVGPEVGPEVGRPRRAGWLSAQVRAGGQDVCARRHLFCRGSRRRGRVARIAVGAAAWAWRVWRDLGFRRTPSDWPSRGRPA